MISLFLPETKYMHSIMVDILHGQPVQKRIPLYGELRLERYSDTKGAPLPELKVFIDGKDRGFTNDFRALTAGSHILEVVVKDVSKKRHIEIRPDSPLLVRYKISVEPTQPADNSNADMISF